MILLDAYALLAYLRDEPAAESVTSILRTNSCAMSAVNLAEVLDQLLRIDRLEKRDVSEALSGLIGGPITVLSVDESVAWRAAEIRARHYGRKESNLSLADCVLIASTGPDDALATADPAVASAARAEGIGVRELPGSRRKSR